MRAVETRGGSRVRFRPGRKSGLGFPVLRASRQRNRDP